MSEDVWRAARGHMFGSPGEHFVFFLARASESRRGPILLANEVILVPDEHVSGGWDGMEVSADGFLEAVNAAARGGYCLIEGHNHGGGSPRFSGTDRHGLDEFLPYVWASLPDRPYAATVWGEDGSVFGRYYRPDGAAGDLQSALVPGSQLLQIVSRDGDRYNEGNRFDRQAAWFGEGGQERLGRFRVAVVGAGGTGSHVIQQLAYLGCRDVVLVDPDRVDETNMNRLVTASAADVGTSKAVLGRRMIRSITPGARVEALEMDLRRDQAIDALKGVDVIFGCVDNDGARLVLNQLSLAYGIPYIDTATGIEVGEEGRAAGGRVTVVRPGGPCLVCMDELDRAEASFFLAPRAEQEERLARGYVTGIDAPAPSVVGLNGVLASQAIMEFMVWVAGARPPTAHTSYDALGVTRTTAGQHGAPIVSARNPDCEVHAIAGRGDEAGLARFARSLVGANSNGHGSHPM